MFIFLFLSSSQKAPLGISRKLSLNCSLCSLCSLPLLRHHFKAEILVLLFERAFEQEILILRVGVGLPHDSRHQDTVLKQHAPYRLFKSRNYSIFICHIIA